ncbi:death-on-curing family protein [Rhizobium phaseoli]|uniref:type II toxin-antitoxin system death-on-curing family toxin n=1 Tax=Rhizobium phaseoli TaxID=396 RepID=UPI00030FA722|nr:type II toxin-antitoxin system death-on-curing family toxin [Rhizobium phaseoli]KKZ87112.1 death-on-curing family (prophage maintenance system killer) protein [Rhizobium phaseoli Ch24-10]RDJ13282.1 death-on-curing family protein [Rhizobium phaseoli]RDJ16424.1 death-on-curing family protein [Rhizobium phaseoli]
MIRLKWLSRQAVENMHGEQIAEHGGLSGLRDANALETSLAPPLNKAAYGETDIFVLAAAYLYGIVRNHPFGDGNKRTGYLATFTFLYLNRYIIEADNALVIALVLDVAAGEIEEEGAARFLRDFSVPLNP